MNTFAHPLVLVVDDQRESYDAVRLVAKGEGWNAEWIDCGEAALDFLKERIPDLVLLDVSLPGIDGLEVCRSIRQLPYGKNIPIVMITGWSHQEMLYKCFEAGADDFISKPLEHYELLPRARTQIISYRRLRDLRSAVERHETLIRILRKTISRSVPHELRTPLAGIAMPMELLLAEGEEMDWSTAKELLEVMNESVERLDRLVTRFSTYLEVETLRHRIDEGRNYPYVCEEIMLSDYVYRVARECAESHQRVDDLRLSGCPKDVRVKIFPFHFERALFELVDNACKFSPQGHPVSVTLEVEKDSVRLVISDRGKGIDEAQFSSAGAYVQFDRDYHEQQGSGLGLAIARGVADLYGGRLTLRRDDSEEIGSCIVFELPYGS